MENTATENTTIVEVSNVVTFYVDNTEKIYGRIFKTTRKALGLSVSDVSFLTGFREHFITCFEKGELGSYQLQECHILALKNALKGLFYTNEKETCEEGVLFRTDIGEETLFVAKAVLEVTWKELIEEWRRMYKLTKELSTDSPEVIEHSELCIREMKSCAGLCLDFIKLLEDFKVMEETIERTVI